MVPSSPSVVCPNHRHEAAFLFLQKVADSLNYTQIEPDSGFPRQFHQLRGSRVKVSGSMVWHTHRMTLLSVLHCRFSSLLPMARAKPPALFSLSSPKVNLSDAGSAVCGPHPLIALSRAHRGCSSFPLGMSGDHGAQSFELPP